MPDGGTLTLAVRNAEAGTAEQPAGDHVLIEMIDTGRGMDEATQARAFEPFFSTKGPGHGTGLGLSMVHGFVHQSGGTIRCRAPRARERPCSSSCRAPGGRSPVRRPAGAALRAERKACWWWRTTPMCGRWWLAQIKSLGYRVAEAEHGDAALAVLEERPDGFDLLISDMVMPGEIDGLGLAKRPGSAGRSLRSC